MVHNGQPGAHFWNAMIHSLGLINRTIICGCVDMQVWQNYLGWWHVFASQNLISQAITYIRIVPNAMSYSFTHFSHCYCSSKTSSNISTVLPWTVWAIICYLLAKCNCKLRLDVLIECVYLLDVIEVVIVRPAILATTSVLFLHFTTLIQRYVWHTQKVYCAPFYTIQQLKYKYM